MMLPFLYDAGALIAAERSSRFVWQLHRKGIQDGRRCLIPAPVLAQVWRGGPRQARLAAFVASCDVLPLDEPTARAGGVLIGATATQDVVDAVVVVLAAIFKGIVITSDPDDIGRLIAGIGVPVPDPITV
jgi:hypothetical protein